MSRIVLKTRVYGPYRNRLLSEIESDIINKFTELDVTLSKIKTDGRGYILVSLDGPDSEFARNVLISEYGGSLNFEDLRVTSIVNGSLVDVGKVGYGLYVDIGVVSPSRTDLLIPLHRLRSQMGMEGKSLRQIITACLLVDNLPIEVEVSQLNSLNLTIEGAIAQSSLERFEYWLNDDHERLFVFGANYAMVESALRRTRHLEDIYEVESLGRHEHVLVCKRSTRASGIISAIGPLLRGVPMHLFIPREIKAMRNDST